MGASGITGNEVIVSRITDYYKNTTPDWSQLDNRPFSNSQFDNRLKIIM